MLIKLIKYDLKWLFKKVLPISLFTGLLILFMGISKKFDLLPQDNTVSVLVMMFVGFGITIGSAWGFMASFTRYYKNLCTDEAYLSLSLPVTGSQQLCAKTISAIVCIVLHAAVIAAASLCAALMNIKFTSLVEFFRILGSIIKYVFNAIAGPHSADAIIMMVLYFIMSSLSLIYVIFDIMTLSSYMKKGKGIVSLLLLLAAGFVIGFIQQCFTSLFTAIFGAEKFLRSLSLMLMPTVITDLLLVIVSFIMLKGIFDKHLNLN